MFLKDHLSKHNQTSDPDNDCSGSPRSRKVYIVPSSVQDFI